MFGRKQQDDKHWVKVTGKVLRIEILPGPSSPHPKLFVVELQMEDGTPMRAEIKVNQHRPVHGYEDLFFRGDHDDTGFLFKPATREVRFDMTDPRNSGSAHRAATSALVRSLNPDLSSQDIADSSGRPWLVGPRCPTCRKEVDQRRASMDNRPHCLSCMSPLPAFPLRTSPR
jgi:hypothetical protein